MKKTTVLILLLATALLLTGCTTQTESQKNYLAAQELLTKGEYAQAANAFAALGSYENAGKLTMYAKAVAAGEAGEYGDAVASLEALGDFKDATLQATYYKARQYESMGAYSCQNAAELYDSIPLFRDSKARAADCLARYAAQESAVIEEADADKPGMFYGAYNFRGLPWGASAEFVTSLYDMQEANNSDTMNLDMISNGTRYGNAYTNRGLSKQFSASYRDGYGTKVGGLFTDTWTCYFANLPVDGKLTYDEEDTFLYAARYEFDTYDQNSAYESTTAMATKLISRLTDLYGEPTTPALPGSETHITRWEGFNDTSIVLYYNANDKYSIYLTYLWKGGDQLLNEANAATNTETSEYKRLFMDCAGL